jgi:hypothetical protein
MNLCQKKKVRVWTGQYFNSIEGVTTYKKRIGINLIHVDFLANKISFTEWYEKPSPAPTLICLPCCPVFACSKVGT